MCWCDILAGVLVVVHVCWITGMTVALFTPWYTRITVIHLTMQSATALVWLRYRECPFLTFENWARMRCDPDFERIPAFIPRYAAKWFGIHVPPEAVLVAFIIIVAVTLLKMALRRHWKQGGFN
jgi:hypothetical protein